MSDRELVLEAAKAMPDSATIQEIVRQRLERNPKGNGIPADEVLRQVASWVTT